jgi:hypothetical protein
VSEISKAAVRDVRKDGLVLVRLYSVYMKYYGNEGFLVRDGSLEARKIIQ